MLTSASTAALKDHRPETNATVWQRLENAGALCIAKTNSFSPALSMKSNFLSIITIQGLPRMKNRTLMFQVALWLKIVVTGLQISTLKPTSSRTSS